MNEHKQMQNDRLCSLWKPSCLSNLIYTDTKNVNICMQACHKFTRIHISIYCYYRLTHNNYGYACHFLRSAISLKYTTASQRTKICHQRKPEQPSSAELQSDNLRRGTRMIISCTTIVEEKILLMWKTSQKVSRMTIPGVITSCSVADQETWRTPSLQHTPVEPGILSSRTKLAIHFIQLTVTDVRLRQKNIRLLLLMHIFRKNYIVGRSKQHAPCQACWT